MKKKLLALLILFVVIGGSVSAFAYWDSLSVDETGNSVTLGHGVTLTLSSSTVDSTDNLVPSGVVMKTGDVTSIVFTYNVKLDEAVPTDLALTSTVSNVVVGDGTAALNALSIPVVSGSNTVNGTDVQVFVTVTLTEPTDQALYVALQNNAVITFDVNFTAN